MNKINEEEIVDVQVVHRKYVGEYDKDDCEAVVAILGGDRNKYKVIFNRYYHRIKNGYSYSLGFDRYKSEDLTMELFEKVFSKLDQYNPELYSFNAWITSCAKYHLIDYWRKKKLETVSIDVLINDENSNNNFHFNYINDSLIDVRDKNPEEEMEYKEMKKNLKSSMAKLDCDSGDILTKRYIDGMSYQEIADKKNIPLGTVKVGIFRAKKKLMEIIIGEGEMEFSCS